MRRLYIPVAPGALGARNPLGQAIFLQNDPLEDWEPDKKANWENMGYEVLEIMTRESTNGEDR